MSLTDFIFNQQIIVITLALSGFLLVAAVFFGLMGFLNSQSRSRSRSQSKTVKHSEQLSKHPRVPDAVEIVQPVAANSPPNAPMSASASNPGSSASAPSGSSSAATSGTSASPGSSPSTPLSAVVSTAPSFGGGQAAPESAVQSILSSTYNNEEQAALYKVLSRDTQEISMAQLAESTRKIAEQLRIRRQKAGTQ